MPVDLHVLRGHRPADVLAGLGHRREHADPGPVDELRDVPDLLGVTAHSSAGLDVAAPGAALRVLVLGDLLAPPGTPLALHPAALAGRADLLDHAGRLPVDLDHY